MPQFDENFEDDFELELAFSAEVKDNRLFKGKKLKNYSISDIVNF